MKQISTDIILSLNKSFDLELPEKISLDEVKKQLSIYINQLIESDFQKLVSLLYRVDINEAKLKYLLQENRGENAGNIIAEMIMERQLQKIQSRQQYRQKDAGADEAERW
jgi:hypothetical protein